jgi:hypothetical protein
MRNVLCLVAVLPTVAVATIEVSPARADTTMRGSWVASCTSTVTEIELGGSELPRLIFSQAGADSLPRTIRIALELRAAAGGTIPDAWRFDT